MKNIYFSYKVFEYSPDLLKVISDACSSAGYTLVDSANMESGSILPEVIIETINNCDIVIADMTDDPIHIHNDIGIALGLNKPIIYIVNGDYLQGLKLLYATTIYYNLSHLDQFKKRLLNFISEIEKGPEKLKSNNSESQRKYKPKIFISYNHKDVQFLERLIVHLKPYEKNGAIEMWSDTRIMTGEDWEERIAVELNNSTIAILLVSANFLASDFITANELPPIITKAKDKGLKVIPIILSPCRYVRHPELTKIKALNVPEKPLLGLSEYEQELIWDELSEDIYKEINKKSKLRPA